MPSKGRRSRAIPVDQPDSQSRFLELDKGVLTISLDFELIWGTLDLFGPDKFARACLAERELVPRLLDLFVEFDVRATWCILGHLFLQSCNCVQGSKHPEIVRPRHAWHSNDWFEHDPCTTEESAPLFYGRELVERIRSCAVAQEIGCHSFSHAIFGDSGCSAQTAESELAACMRLAESLGIEMRSFAFPRNAVGHLDVLKAHGFQIYRGPEPTTHSTKPWNNIIKRIAHLSAVIRAAEPPVVSPEWVEPGLWNIPGSMIYFPMHGLRRYIPIGRRVRRAIKGLDAAVRERKVFHLWFHPTNLADEPEKMFAGLRAILTHATDLVDRGVLRIQSMADIVTNTDRSVGTTQQVGTP
jgi:peptidoglycan/xylan/chitin deacetylase (PgdA/CDA1 family)